MTQQNPFLERGMLKNAGRFFGRQVELDFCLARLRMMQCVSIVGERRIGKSSFLYRLTQIIPQELDARPVHYVDLQAIPDDKSFWPAVLADMGKEGETQLDFTRVLREQQVVLCLDEFERVADYGNFGNDFFNTLRSMANQGYLAMVTATQTPLNALVQTDLTSSFFNLFVRQDLQPFVQEEQKAVQASVLETAQESGAELTPDEVTRAWTRTNGHPWELAIYLSHLWDAKQAGPVDWGSVEKLYLAETAQGVSERRVEREGILDTPGSRRLENWITGLVVVAGVIFLFGLTIRNIPLLWTGILLAVIDAVLILYASLRTPRSV